MAAIQIEQLRSSVRGAIVQPDDEAYETARMVYNRMIDRCPPLIVRCVDVADIIVAAIKRQYDPANLFRVNQNIRRAAATV